MNRRVSDVFKVGFYISVFTFVFSIFIQMTLSYYFGEEHEGNKYFNYNFFLFVVLSPVIESMISIIILTLCSTFISKNSSCIALGVVWAGLHSTMGSDMSNSIGFWLISFISFSLYGWLYFRYKYPKFSINMIVITFPHSLHNLYVYTLLS